MTVVIISPDIETFVNTPTVVAVPVPTITQIFSTTTVGQSDALQNSQSVIFKPRNFIPISPFILKPIQDAISKWNGDSRVVLVECVKAVKDFDTKHANNADYADKENYKCKEIILWLYLMSQDNEEINAV